MNKLLRMKNSPILLLASMLLFASSIIAQPTIPFFDYPFYSTEEGLCTRDGVELYSIALPDPNCEDQILYWEALVDINADGIHDYEFSSLLPANDNIFDDTNGNGVPDIYVAPTMGDDTVKIFIPEVIEASRYAHEIVWRVTDECGLVSARSMTFQVVDREGPEIEICRKNEPQYLSDTQISLEFTAIDLVESAQDNCTEDADLRYTFSSSYPEDDNKYIPELRSSTIIVTNYNCDLPVYVWDEFGNYGVCNFNINFFSNDYQVAGSIKSRDGIPIENSEVIHSQFKINNSNSVAHFIFPQLLCDSSYLTIINEDRTIFDLSTLDLILLLDHINGENEIVDYYDLISADIDQNGVLDVVDINHISNLILLKEMRDISWKFYDSNNFSLDPNIASPPSAVFRIENSSFINGQLDVVGLKLGDVSGSAPIYSPIISSNTPVTIEIEDQYLDIDDESEVTLQLIEFNNTRGFQFYLDCNGLEILDVSSSLDDFGSSNFNVINGNLIVSYHTGQLQDMTSESITLKMKATQQLQLSKHLSFDNNSLAAEVYQNNFIDIYPLLLDFKGLEKSTELFQNVPNPFLNNTNINFYLREQGDVAFTFYDLMGRQLYHKVYSQFDEGLHSISLSSDDLFDYNSGNGNSVDMPTVVICTMITDNYSNSIKMVSGN